MPFTPFHWGPTSCIGLPLFRVFDFPTLLLANVVIDCEPLCVLIIRLNNPGVSYPAHGIFHSFLGSSFLAVLTGIALFFLRHKIRKIMTIFELQQDSSFEKVLLSSFFGFYFHVLLDSLIYTDIKPFYPFEINPVYGWVSILQMYLFCSVSFLIAALFYLVRLYWKG
ncbi:MAG: metal-dependent hydrolase [Candidatus Methanofastidiosia archaeon]|jgi:membrane-bound metal-dependent hydrolase YbcI (DUF457 family)